MGIDMDRLAEEHYAKNDPEYQNDDEEELDYQFEDWSNKFLPSDFQEVKDAAKTVTLSINNLFGYISEHYPNDLSLIYMVKNASRNFSIMKEDMKI